MFSFLTPGAWNMCLVLFALFEGCESHIATHNFEHSQQQIGAGRSLVNHVPEDKKDQTVSNYTNVSKNVIFVVISPFRNLLKKSYSHNKIIMSDTLTAQP